MPDISATRLKTEFKRLSLKTRLLLAATLWLSAMMIAAGILIPGLVRDYLSQDLETKLGLTMDEIAANLEVNKQGQLVLQTRLSDPRFNQPYSGMYWSVDSGSDKLRSRSLWDRTIRIKNEKHKATYFGAKDEKLIAIKRTVFLPDISDGVTIIIGQDEDRIDDTLNLLTGQLWLILGVLSIGILTLVVVQVSWSLRPLGKMQKELKLLKTGERQTLDEQYPKEIAPLVSDLNALLFHYQELLARARNHAGNLSHALKTPLSVLKNELHQLSEQDRQRLQPSIEQIQAHIDYHLGRTRMAGAMNILSVKSSPSERVDAISLAFDKVYAQRDIALVSELDTDQYVAVEKADLDEMLGNLLENAYKWGNSFIRVYSELLDNHEIAIIVEDDGPGIPQEKLKEVLKRGVRLDETIPGTGLGLNIVNEMAHSYRGDLALESSKLGGLRAVLKLQRAKE
ncbi:ATP-binding protein [Vibrio mediterranei]|uniref:ATP-binding protein n=1 Tax=Vibrio TaxID=662 RepID=UPI001EFCFDF6|nr:MULTISPECIES: ATP-binding protein [Vibrio]MCF4173254.1 ATP-binding protein [Vibrio sp. McD22-P3]MCG9661827.1 ATP-binding protein [Vibrio mediterranei]